MIREVRNHLVNGIIPFWKSLRDEEYGGYYGYMDYDLGVDKKAVKGCILNSRILWFFSNAAILLEDRSLLAEAEHAYAFLRDHCIDPVNGGVFWSMTYDGKPEDTTKHTYNQAFAVYALSSYYGASKDSEALGLAKELYDIIERKCKDEGGYLEAQDAGFHPIDNEKLSENGVMAERTMNTLLHVMEAFTELYRVSGMPEVKRSLEEILDLYAEHIYNPDRHRQEVFFDRDYHSLIDLCSYGHDIESAWLLDRTLFILNENRYTEKLTPVTKDLTDCVFRTAFDGRSLANECEKGVVDELRIWWVQAEALVGFLNGYQKDPAKKEYLDAAKAEWNFISDHVIDSRKGSEWFSEVTPSGSPVSGVPLVEPWKCPYHNGRMCFEVIRRGIE